MTREHHVLFLGDSGVGKSSLIMRFMYNFYIDEGLLPHTEKTYRMIVDIGEPYFLNVLETTNFSFDETVKANAFLENEGFMIAFSLTDKNTFLNLSNYMDDIRHYREGTPVPILLVGTKCDLEASRVVTENEISSITKQWGVSYIETSASKLISVRESFDSIARLIVNAHPNGAPQPPPRRKKCTLL